LFFWLGCLSVRAELPLPTPMDHYEKFKPGLTGLALASAIFPQLDPTAQQILLQLKSFVETTNLPKTPPISKEQALILVKSVDW